MIIKAHIVEQLYFIVPSSEPSRLYSVVLLPRAISLVAYLYYTQYLSYCVKRAGTLPILWHTPYRWCSRLGRMPTHKVHVG